MNMKGYDNLRCAIVEQAAKDYMKAKKRYLKSKNKDRQALYRINECTKFFKSEYYIALMPNLDGEAFIKMLDKKVDEEMS